GITPLGSAGHGAGEAAGGSLRNLGEGGRPVVAPRLRGTRRPVPAAAPRLARLPRSAPSFLRRHRQVLRSARPAGSVVAALRYRLVGGLPGPLELRQPALVLVPLQLGSLLRSRYRLQDQPRAPAPGT